jgi:hypothetical protein
MVIVRAGRAPGSQSGIDSPLRTRGRVGRGLTLIAIHPRTLQITVAILLGFTLGSFAAIQGLARDIGKRVVIVRRVTVVVIVPHFTFTITFFVLDGYAWP